MIRVFNKAQIPIHADLVHKKKVSMFPSEYEVKILKELEEALEAVEWATTSLGSRNVTLAQADEFFEVTLGRLWESKSEIARSLAEKLYTRILQRRLKTVATLLAYLENPHFLKAIGKQTHLSYATKNEITEFMATLYERLYPFEDVASSQGGGHAPDLETNEGSLKTDQILVLLRCQF